MRSGRQERKEAKKDMAVARANPKKKRKQQKAELVRVGTQALHKAIIYSYLADVKKFKQEDIEALNLYFVRTVKGIETGNASFDDIMKTLESHGIDLQEVGRKSDDWMDKYGHQWK